MNQFFKKLLSIQKSKKTFLSVGLDPNLDKLPQEFKGKPHLVFDFLKAIVDSTHPYACCFKPQIAYFSAYALEETLFKIIEYIHLSYPETLVILDAKRNDIGSTAEMYAREAFVRYQADAITVNPYMGGDTIEPFTQYKDKGIFVLCRTSNEGAKEFQNITVGDGEALYSFVAKKATNIKQWNKNENIGLVVGATAINELRKIRSSNPEAWFLVPGVGAQGGDLKSVIEYGRRVDAEGGLIINSSRGILYASDKSDFAIKAGEEAARLQLEMAKTF
jgi:orotidine-5'-phosphate decarboxylase